MRFNDIFLAVITVLISACTNQKQFDASEVKVSGAMKNVMKKGDLTSTINLDTLSNKQFLYGIGPGESLIGEILVINGRSYRSYIKHGELKMKESFAIKSPFFVYTNQADFFEVSLPEYVKDELSLSAFLDEFVSHVDKPFVFKLSGIFDTIDFHVQNLPLGTKIHSSEDAHKGQAKFNSNNTSGEVIGFFSRNHQGIFTHHDSFIHLHYISEDYTEMGHVDALKIDKNKISLFLPGN